MTEGGLPPALCDLLRGMRRCATAELLYERMASQSGRSLPLIYQPFDPDDAAHWADRGAAHDFSLAAGDGRLLDLGPGDGWPALIVAPYAREVVGVDGAARRVAVCCENAARLGIENARFTHVPPGEPLPFPDAVFDGAMAASSIEQTPDPAATLREIHRLLKPGGSLRLRYEALGRYRGGREREIDWLSIEDDACLLLIYDRHPDEEWAQQAGLLLDLDRRAAQALVPGVEREGVAALTAESLAALHPHMRDVALAVTHHPSGPTLARWLREIGFHEVRGTHDGVTVARELFHRLPPAQRHISRGEIDALLRPITAVALTLAAPLEHDPTITAIK